MTSGVYYYCIRLFRRLFSTESEELYEKWDITSDLTDISDV